MENMPYDILINGIPQELRVEEVLPGASWTSARLSNGSVGIAAHFAGNAGNLAASMTGMSVRDAAGSVNDCDCEAAGMGLAVINAFYNSVSRLSELDCGVSYETFCTDGLDLIGKTVGVIGRMRRTAEHLFGAKQVYIFELEPREGESPASDEAILLPECDIVIATGTSLMNHTLPEILEYSKSALVIFLGPSVAMCPDLRSCGIERLSGLVISEKDAFWSWNQVSRGSPMSFGKSFLIR